MNALFATVTLLNAAPWLSSAAPAKTERRGCRAGYALNPISDLCELCPAGTFTDSYNWEGPCQPCSICNGGRQMVAACTASSNTLCRCADDHYEHLDGCSPKPGTTRSGIDDVNSVLQGLGEQLGTEIQKVLNKIDNFTEIVEDLRETAASSAHAEKGMQEKMHTIEFLIIAVCVLSGGGLIIALIISIIHRRVKLPNNVWCCQQCRDDQGNTRTPNGGIPRKERAQGGEGGAASAQSPTHVSVSSTVEDHDESVSTSNHGKPAGFVDLSVSKQARKRVNDDMVPGGSKDVHSGRHDTLPKDGMPINQDHDAELQMRLLSGQQDR